MMDRMQPYQIIQHCDELKDSDQDWKKVYATVLASVQSNKYRVMRSGDTLFWYKLLAPHQAQVFVFNADTNKNFLRNFKDFAKAMHKAGFKKVFGETENPQMINVIKRLGFPVDVEKTGQMLNGKPVYRGTVNV
jgi:hypothetical protein